MSNGNLDKAIATTDLMTEDGIPPDHTTTDRGQLYTYLQSKNRNEKYQKWKSV